MATQTPRVSRPGNYTNKKTLAELMKGKKTEQGITYDHDVLLEPFRAQGITYDPAVPLEPFRAQGITAYKPDIIPAVKQNAARPKYEAPGEYENTRPIVPIRRKVYHPPPPPPTIQFNQPNMSEFIEPSKRRYQKKGKGSFGMTYRNKEESGTIIKKYFKPETLQNAYETSQKFAKMSGNTKVNGKIESIKHKNLENGIFNSSSINVLRMPDFGEDMITVVSEKEHITKITSQPDYVSKLLGNICSVLEYTSNIAKNQYCHGDMHMANIMIDPATCEMHIIDFDFFEPFYKNTELIMTGKRKEFLKYWIPPEYIFLRKMDLNDEPYDELKLDNEIDKYVKDTNIQYYLYNFMNITNDLDKYSDYIHECNRKNFDHVISMKKRVNQFDLLPFISSNVMQYFDNFALGIALRILLHVIFDGQNTSTQIDKTNKLLERMASFTISERPTPKDAYEEMTRILLQKGARRKTIRRRRTRRAF